MALDRERILEVVAYLKASPVAELAIGEGEFYCRVALQPLVTALAVPDSEGAPAATSSDPSVADEALGGGEAEEQTSVVTARVVGLFYLGKKPGGPPLVQVGDSVEEGQALGTIEVLRKPTEITCPVAGEIIEIAHADGTGVQYGDPLFVIRTA